jgi:hypothetical protein
MVPLTQAHVDRNAKYKMAGMLGLSHGTAHRMPIIN